MTTENNDLNRREFLKVSGAAAVAGAVAANARDVRADAAPDYSVWPFKVAPIPQVRIGFVGVGLQGTGHVENLVQIPGCRVTAICDIDQTRIDINTKIITGAGHPAPKVYNKGVRDFERLCETEELDLVYTATPWEWHVPVMLAAMK